MSENMQNPNQQSPDLAALAALLQQAQATTTPAATGWNQPKPASTANVVGVSVPISLQTPIGKIRVYLHFGAEHAASPQALNSLLEGLAGAGLPLDAWQGNQGGNGGWNGGQSNGFKRRY